MPSNPLKYQPTSAGATKNVRVAFDSPDLHSLLVPATRDELDELKFGVIGFDANGNVTRFNQFESQKAGMSTAKVMDQSLFDKVAPCMNNFVVSGQFEACAKAGQALDKTVEFVFTIRMRPTRVRLRLLSDPRSEQRFIAVHWNPPRSD